MLGSDVLEIAIGVVFVFLIASLIASAVREMIEALLKTRAVQLEKGMRQLLDDHAGTGIMKELFDHPLLFGLYEGTYEPEQQLAPTWTGRAFSALRRDAAAGEAKVKTTLQWASNLPSYIPSRNFALALLDLVAGTGRNGEPLTLDSIKASAMTLPDGHLRKAVLVAVGEAGDDLDRARASIEAWFDGNMDRVSGWYKRKTQALLVLIGLVIAILLNIDSLNVARELATNTASRQLVMARVDAVYSTLKDNQQGGQPLLTPEQLRSEARGLSQVIGWPAVRERAGAEWDSKRNALAAQARANPALKDLHAKAQWVLAQIGDRDRYVKDQVRRGIPASIPGWLLTALAVSLGAPFWFDLLNKFMVIRSTVKPYEKSSPEGSEDRRGGGKNAAQQLAPGPLQPALQPPGPLNALAAPAGAVAGAVPGGIAATARIATVRLALDTAGLAGVSLTKNGAALAVPSDGFVEVPLEVDIDHVLAATAKRTADQAVVRWKQEIRATLDSEGQPITATFE